MLHGKIAMIPCCLLLLCRGFVLLAALFIAAQQHLVAGLYTINGYNCPTAEVSLSDNINSDITSVEQGKTYLLSAGSYYLYAEVLLATANSTCFIGTSPADVTISTIGAGALVVGDNNATLGLQGLTLIGSQSDGSQFAVVGGLMVSAGILTARDVVMQGYKQRSALYATGSPADIKLDSVVFRNNDISILLGSDYNNVVYLAITTSGLVYQWNNVSPFKELTTGFFVRFSFQGNSCNKARVRGGGE